MSGAPTPTPHENADLDRLIAELRLVRGRGLLRLRAAQIPALRALASPDDSGGPDTADIGALLRSAIATFDGATLAKAAEYTFGLVPGTRDWPAMERRRHAARLCGVSVERFRKHQERIVLEQVAEAIARGQADSGGGAPDAASTHPAWHDTTEYAFSRGHGRPLTVVLHWKPFESIRGLDAVIVPENTYFQMSALFKTSLSAAVRRGGAHRTAAGEVVEDTVQLELDAWLRRHARIGLAVPPGTVAATSAGRLVDHGVRRVYHAAIAVPRSGADGYSADPTAISDAVTRAWRMAVAERDDFTPPLKALGVPLLGAGRAALDPVSSFRAVWNALSAESRDGDAPLDVHLFGRSPTPSFLHTQLLSVGARPKE